MKNYKKKILTLIIPGLLYLLTSIPLRKVLSVFTVTDVRPSIAIVPLTSMWFGPLAALSCALGNFIFDVLTNNSPIVLALSIPLQFSYGFVAWLLWKKLTKGDDHSYRFDSVSKILKFTFVTLSFSILSATCVGLFVYCYYKVPFFDTFKFVFLNNFDMTILFGCPSMIVANLIISKKKNEPIRKLSFSEMIIIYTSVIVFVGAIVIGFAVYNGLAGETFDIWNSIYYKVTIYINIVFACSLIFMSFFNRKLIVKNK